MTTSHNEDTDYYIPTNGTGGHKRNVYHKHSCERLHRAPGIKPVTDASRTDLRPCMVCIGEAEQKYTNESDALRALKAAAEEA